MYVQAAGPCVYVTGNTKGKRIKEKSMKCFSVLWLKGRNIKIYNLNRILYSKLCLVSPRMIGYMIGLTEAVFSNCTSVVSHNKQREVREENVKPGVRLHYA